VRDIGKRKAAEEALRASRERASLLAGLLDESSQPFMAGTPDGRLLLFNPAFQRLVGRSGRDLSLARWPDDLTAPEHLEMERATLAEVARTGVPARYEKEMLRPDGSRVPVEVLRHAEFDESGRVSYYFAFFTDVSERRAIERLNVALNTIGTAVSATLEESEIVRRLVSGTAEALEAEVAGFLRADQGMWILSATHGLPDAAGGARMLLADVPAAKRAMDALEPVVCDEGACRSDLGTLSTDTPGVRSALFFPLMVRGAAMGVAFFAERVSGDGYADVQRDFAARLMSTVSLTLENARLYESQRHIADTLQRAVLAPPEDIEGMEVAWLYRPASAAADVGGDFYDIFRIDERRAGIVIGDVSGKGVSAARLTSLMRDGLRAYSYINPDVAWVLGHTNDLVHRSTDPEEFATVFFGVLDLKTNRLDYCGAGHPTVALVRGEGSSVALESRGALLGAFEHMRFAVDSVTIEPGDRLVLYTDGVTEARSDGELFGEDNAFQAACDLAVCELPEVPCRLLERVLAFSGGALRDDCVIVAIERTGSQ
jgi:PAS domain S-box-containing protein